MTNPDKIFFEPDGRAYRKEPIEKKVPIYTFIYGKFTGKFYSDKEKTNFERAEFFDFKIYEGEVEILYKNDFPKSFVKDKKNAVTIKKSQLPDKIYYFERTGDDKIYYGLNLQNPEFHNFKFIDILQQTEENEAFGTVEGDIYGYLVQYESERWFKKRYKKLKLIKREGVNPPPPPKEPTEPPGRPTEPPKKPKEPVIGGGGSGRDITFRSTYKQISPCFRNLLLAAGLTLFSLLIGFTPAFVVGLIWLLYIVYKCYFNWIKYLGYLFLLLFLIGLGYSVFNTNWNQRIEPYIPKATVKDNRRPELVKVIRLVSKDKAKSDLLITHRMTWYNYSGVKYEGEYNIKKSDLDASRLNKNNIPLTETYSGVLYSISNHDSNRLEGLYKMFDEIKKQNSLNTQAFTEMVVSFVQNIPYYVVLDGSCGEQNYKDENIKALIRENPGKCCPNQRFGITSPVEFMVNLQGDCDSRTVLLYTILKHYNINAAILSSDVYRHSVLGVSLPYNGVTYKDMGKSYVLWETTDIFRPGMIPLQIGNLSNWYISLK